jgi:hypothetical protein
MESQDVKQQQEKKTQQAQQGMSKPDSEATEKLIKLFINDEQVHQFTPNTRVSEVVALVLGDKKGFLFLSDAEEPLDSKKTLAEVGITKQGNVYTSLCQKVEITVEYMSESKTHKFSSSIKLKAIQNWALEQNWNPAIDPSERCNFAFFASNSGDEPLPEASRLAAYVNEDCCTVTFELAYRRRQQG